MNLDFMPSPVEDRPGLLIRDSYGYSDAVLIIPPPLVACLTCFDGEQTELELKEHLVRITGELDVSALGQHLTQTLSVAGFLHDEVYGELQDAKHREFSECVVREPAHAGSAYPDEVEATKRTLAKYMTGTDLPASDKRLAGIAAPHVSPSGGWQTYRAAYSALEDVHRDRTFVVLGTSHYGEPDRFGLTRKPFVTPYGQVVPDLRLIDELARQPAAKMEDYCHAVEHSIEFQVLFLQHLFGPDIRVVPVLCGSFARSLSTGRLPDDDEGVRRFLDALGEIAAREGDRLLWVLGIDMAHMGVRYQDGWPAKAQQGEMVDVERRDRERIDRINASDARGFWELLQPGEDDLKWCGSSPIYTFLKAVPNARGTLRGYEQWNIDQSSVVSFAGLAFTRD